VKVEHVSTSGIGTLVAGLIAGLVIGAFAGAAVGYLLTRNRVAFGALAQARLAAGREANARDLADRQHALESMVAPLQNTLIRVQSELERSERERVAAGAALDEHLAWMRASADGLRQETSRLVTALRSPQVRGRWGELQLERAVEAAGMVEHVDYCTQVTAAGEQGTVRPDLVVRLVGGKYVVVDSKVAFAGYLEAMEAVDDGVRAARLRAHARHLRAHVDSLASKRYWDAFASPEFVVCFVPADAFLDAALKEDPDLLEHAFARNVVLATPSTLVALLRTVGHTWRQEALARNAAEVSSLGKELHQRLLSMSTQLDKLGRSLSTAVETFNRTIGTFEHRVLVSARRFTELGAVRDGPLGGLTEPEQILATTRSVAPESGVAQVR
jgi:DNA recombination protein RmuC